MIAPGPRAARFARTLLPDVAYLPLAMVAAWSLVALAGFPHTHDGVGLERIEMYRRTYLVGDFFPAWTALASNGHGSPHLLLYHRLHAQLFGLLSLAVGSLIAAKAGVVLLLAFGAAGMRRLSEMHGVRPWLAWLAGALLLASNYADVDWYVRGAIAELMAFMLVPWCVGALIGMVDRNESPLRFGIWCALLFYGHMVVSMFFAFLVLSVLAERLSRARDLGWEGLRRLTRQMFVAGATAAVCVVPFAAAVMYVEPLCGVNDYGMEPAKTYPFSEYLFDPNVSWLGQLTTDRITVEIGRYIVLPLVALLVCSPAARGAVRGRVWRLFVPAVCFVLLQPRELVFVFDLLPGLSKVQFAWRLLVYIVPIAVLTLAVALEWTLRASAPLWSPVGAGAAIAVVACQLLVTVRAQRDAKAKQYSTADLVPYLSDIETTATWSGFMVGGGRRLPKTPFVAASAGCTFSSPDLTRGRPVVEQTATTHFKLLRLTVHGTGCSLKLSQYASPLLEVTGSKPVQLRTDSDGLMIVDAPNDQTVVSVRSLGILELAGRGMMQRVVTAAPTN